MDHKPQTSGENYLPYTIIYLSICPFTINYLLLILQSHYKSITITCDVQQYNYLAHFGELSQIVLVLNKIKVIFQIVLCQTPVNMKNKYW